MAILNIVGWESGDSAAESVSTTGTVSIQSTTKRTGTYALQANPTTTATGYANVGTIDSTARDVNFDVADVYARFYFRAATLPASNSEPIFSSNRSTGGAIKFELRIDSAGNLLGYGQGTSLLATGTTVLSTGTWYRIEVRVGTGASANWEVKINGTSEISGTADLRSDNNVNVRFGKTTNRNGNTVDFFYDDIAVSDSAYPGASDGVYPLTVDGDGTYTAWTVGAGAGADYTNIDEIPHDSSTTYLLSTLSAGDASTGTLISMPSSSSIYAVKATTFVIRNGAGASFQQRTRSGSTDSDTADITPLASYTDYHQLHATDPNTSSAWTESAVNAIEVGCEERSATAATRLTMAMAQVDYVAAGAGGHPALRRFGLTRFNQPLGLGHEGVQVA